MEQSKIRLPYNFDPRNYQLPLLRALDSGFTRAVWVAHRRSGKDKTLINVVAKKMYERVGAYYYFFPTYNQGRKILWDGRDKAGFKFTDHIPQSLRTGTNNTEMKIETENGSIFQIVGTDKIDSVVGTNPVGCVFSEYALQNPQAWDYMRPILAENGGWAVFNYTPRGENHGYELYQMAQNDPEHWFCQLLTVDDTKVIPQDVLDQERREIIQKDGNDALYQQEYMCSFTVPIAGAYYASHLMRAESEGRITNIPIEPTIPIDTYWDLGIDDSTTIWFVQPVGQELRVIDYYENSGEGLAFYAKVLQDKGYLYGKHTAPHDIEVRELGSGRSRLETARNLGLNFRVAPKLSIEDGIEAGRNILARCWFDNVRCHKGLNALKSYHKEWDEKNKVYRPHPEHDWSSHGADAFRTFAVGFKKVIQMSNDVGGVQPYYPGLPG